MEKPDTEGGAEEVEEGKLKGRGDKRKNPTFLQSYVSGKKKDLYCTDKSPKYDKKKMECAGGRRAAGLFVLCPVGMVEIWSGLQLSRGV